RVAWASRLPFEASRLEHRTFEKRGFDRDALGCRVCHAGCVTRQAGRPRHPQKAARLLHASGESREIILEPRRGGFHGRQETRRAADLELALDDSVAARGEEGAEVRAAEGGTRRSVARSGVRDPENSLCVSQRT